MACFRFGDCTCLVVSLCQRFAEANCADYMLPSTTKLLPQGLNLAAPCGLKLDDARKPCRAYGLTRLLYSQPCIISFEFEVSKKRGCLNSSSFQNCSEAGPPWLTIRLTIIMILVNGHGQACRDVPDVRSQVYNTHAMTSSNL